MSEDDLEDPPIQLPIEDTIDLHPFRPEEIRDVAEEYLLAAREAGYEQVRLIHGRGIGVQRNAIHSLLTRLDFVIGFHDADGSGGGWGATIVELAPKKD